MPASPYSTDLVCVQTVPITVYSEKRKCRKAGIITRSLIPQVTYQIRQRLRRPTVRNVGMGRIMK